jgi:dTDP-4-dehydrorhamnose reductase
MKILVTGSNGLLGQKLVYKLIEQKNIDLIATSKGENRLINKQGYLYESLDITSENEVGKIILKHQPDTIINTAAMTNVDACETDRAGCWASNVTSVENIINAVQKHSLNTHLIHISTDFIFDGLNGPYKETDYANPVSYYGFSKFASEKLLEFSKIKYAILRTIIVYGVVDNMSRSNIVLWAKGALEKGQKINVVDDQFRSPTLAEDLADACILAAEKKITGIYNASGNDFMSILDLVNSVAKFWNLDKNLINPIKSATLNQPAKRPPKTGFILDKIITDLGYSPHSFTDGLKIVDKQLKNIKAV